MLPESRSFYIRGDDGVEYGPADLVELREWVKENRAGLGTEVRRDDVNGSWDTWQSYPELVALLAEVHVTSPVPGVPGLALAPFGRRVLAFGLDFILAAILATPLIFVLALGSGIPDLQREAFYFMTHPEEPAPDAILLYAKIGNLISSTILFLYFAGFIAAHGRTPSKSIFRIHVVDQFGMKPNVLRSAVRAIVLLFSMNILFIPLVWAFFNPQRRALHDYVAGTYVVET